MTTSQPISAQREPFLVGATRRLLFIVNDPAFFVSHRLPLALAARSEGFDVHIATARGEGQQAILDAGLPFHPIPLSRSGKNILRELRSLGAILSLLRKLRPSVVHLVTIKPVLYGGIAAKLTGTPGVLAAISGLGITFTSQGVAASIFRTLVKGLYRLALSHRNLRVVFQNPQDRAILQQIGAVSDEQSVLVPGAGVDLATYQHMPEPEGRPVVAFASRLLKEKGVAEFVKAARLLKKRGVDADFWLIGEPDLANPTSISDEEFESWRADGAVKLLGFRKDVAELFSRAHVVALPSYYGEGLPKVLAEAAACGRAVVTTDLPGCRDAIVPGETGLLVVPKDIDALADALESLIHDPAWRQKMGAAGRRLAEEKFSIESVCDKHVALYEHLHKEGADPAAAQTR